MSRHNFKELKVWQKSRLLVVEVYKLTAQFPSSEKFSLISQINRAVVSISSNIAEGAGRNTDKDFAHFLDIAMGSSFEIESQLMNAKDLEFITENDLTEILRQINEIQKMLVGFQKTLRQ